MGPKIDLEKAQQVVEKVLGPLGVHLSGIYIQDLNDALAALVCKAEKCENEARYTSGYCGICDIQHNAGKGERR